MIKQFCQIGLLFLRIIGLIEAKMLRIGFDENKDIGLVKAIDYKIGFGKNKIIGLIQIKDNQTPTNNPLTTHKPTNDTSQTNEHIKPTNEQTKK